MYTHKGEKRPLIYISNYGDVYIKEGDTVWVEGERVYHSGTFNYPDYHRYLCYVSNLVNNFIYGFDLSDVEYESILFDKILGGEEMTPLEYDQKCIEEIKNNLPHRDVTIARYQFSNSFRPTDSFEYKDGIYIRDEYTYYNPIDLAWYMYRNLYKLLPEDVKVCDAKLWEDLPYLYNSIYKN